MGHPKRRHLEKCRALAGRLEGSSGMGPQHRYGVSLVIIQRMHGGARGGEEQPGGQDLGRYSRLHGHLSTVAWRWRGARQYWHGIGDLCSVLGRVCASRPFTGPFRSPPPAAEFPPSVGLGRGRPRSGLPGTFSRTPEQHWSGGGTTRQEPAPNRTSRPDPRRHSWRAMRCPGRPSHRGPTDTASCAMERQRGSCQKISQVCSQRARYGAMLLLREPFCAPASGTLDHMPLKPANAAHPLQSYITEPPITIDGVRLESIAHTPTGPHAHSWSSIMSSCSLLHAPFTLSASCTAALRAAGSTLGATVHPALTPTATKPRPPDSTQRALFSIRAHSRTGPDGTVDPHVFAVRIAVPTNDSEFLRSGCTVRNIPSGGTTTDKYT